MTPDELAAYFATGFTELDAQIAAHEDGPLKKRAARHSAIAHRALYAIHQDVSETGGISITSPIPKPQ